MTKKEIQEYVEEYINPALAMHGGFLTIKDFDEELKCLDVQLGGGCQGCASSTITLKLMIETALKEEFPELLEIKDVTDHEIGTNPYFE